MLLIYNSLSRKKEKFVPIKQGEIGIYVCGITVYDDCHLGHARSMVSFDVIIRFLRSQGYKVRFVKNITDIDDKIIKRANERNVNIVELTKHYIKSMHEDVTALNILPPDDEPKATEHIEEIIKLISKLIEDNKAYITPVGDVYYQVETFKDYGKLAHKDIEGLLSGARVEVEVAKKSPLDFVLWKSAKQNEPYWDSPWGRGRPGWHIECSAMAMQTLGETFDIHGGGADLQFPHHENEIAQSEGATGKPFANYWVHVGMLQVNQEKMAKSLGNFLLIKDVLKKHHPEVIRYFLLSSHYRSPLNYSEENIDNAKAGLMRLYQSLKDISYPENELEQHWVDSFNKAMNDDFNTPIALSVLFELSREINKTKSLKLASTLKYLGGLLGLFNDTIANFLQSGLASDEKDKIEKLIKERNIARKEKNWAKADKIRNLLLEDGIELEDKADGTVWRRV